MTKLTSGRVAKVPSANVSTDRYDFIDLAETEPDLGLPPGPGYVLTSTIQGVRSWLNPVEFSGVANVSILSGRANVATLADFANVANVVTTLSNFTTANLFEDINLYFTNARVVSALTAGDQIIIEANGRISANVAAVPLDAAAVNAIVQPFLTTANVIESSSNLYFTAERVNATVQPFLTAANIADFTNTVNATIYPSLTTANVIELSSNLYFTNTRVVSALVAGSGIIIESNGRISANISSTEFASQVSSLSNFTTTDLTEGLNLYYTNTRTRAAFTPGKGIAITAGGVITNTGAGFEYNTGIDGSGYGNVLSTLSPIVTFPSIPNSDRFILRSLHITNISDTDVSVSGNVLYATGNTAAIANRLPVPAGASFELLEIPQLFQPSDIVNLQGFDTAGTATSNLLQAIYSYETFTGDITYKGQGVTLATSNTDILVFESALAFSIIESIKFVNLTSSIIPVKLYWADANNVIKAHFAHNLSLPSNSTLETIIKPKRVSQGDRIFASYKNAGSNSVSVFLSARTGYEYTSVGYTPNVTPSGTVSVSFGSSESDGTLIYYTIE